MARTLSWFPTQVYAAPVGGRGIAALNRELLKECHALELRDAEGRRWSEAAYAGGYTSYASLDQVHRMSSTFIALRERLDAHARAYARTLRWGLRGRRLAMTDCWVNVMRRGAAHGAHLHPQAVISGTYYVRTPRGCAGLTFEDPRLPFMLGAPPRRDAAHLTLPARAGQVILFESWLRHGVAPSRTAGERVSISFNYHWV
ncbi:MAG TPA: TIGR02466 family protein [Candidatus Binatia bacterium]|nr:TIGR02466 family protein [Candidatus Binatia bacterium]